MKIAILNADNLVGFKWFVKSNYKLYHHIFVWTQFH